MTELNLSVVFLGAHRSGKSCTLSSMIDSLNRIHCDIRVRYIDELTEDKMRKNNQELINIFSSQNINREEWFDDEQSSNIDFNSYYYTIEIKKKLTIKLCCTDIDISGEKIMDSILSSTYVQLSDVIIVAIDTPQLVENGYRGKIANCVSNVIDMIKTSTVGVNISKQLLFVPIKCEKYVHSRQMNYVVDAIKNTYADLFHYWNNKCNIPAYIVPVQTLGNLEFSHINGQRFCYKYVGNKSYSPRWCEQPMIYAIRYLINKNTL